MNYIDFIIVALLVLGVARGFMDGLVKEVASLAALILGIWGAIKFSSYTAAQLYDFFDMTGRYVGIIAFAITFVVIVIIIHFIGMVIDKFVTSLSLGFLNRLLGTAFGLVKTALILSVILVVLNAIDARHPFLPKEKIEQSRFYNPIADLVPSIFPVLGEGSFEHSFDTFKKKPDGVAI